MSRLHVKTVTVCSKKGEAPTLEDCHLSRPGRGIFVLADGFGGGSVGFEAAKLACHSVAEFLEKEAGDLDATLPFVLRKYFTLAGNVVFNALWHANTGVVEAFRDRAGARGGASVVAGFIEGDTLALANVGACSAWIVRGGKMHRLVTPRTYEAFLNLDPYGAEGAGPAVPLMALGMSEDVEPEIVEAKLTAGDWIVLHTGTLPGILPPVLEGLNHNSLGNGSESVQIELQAALEQLESKDNHSILIAILE